MGGGEYRWPLHSFGRPYRPPNLWQYKHRTLVGPEPLLICQLFKILELGKNYLICPLHMGDWWEITCRCSATTKHRAVQSCRPYVWTRSPNFELMPEDDISAIWDSINIAYPTPRSLLWGFQTISRATYIWGGCTRRPERGVEDIRSS
jgi:hypothetical protein